MRPADHKVLHVLVHVGAIHHLIAQALAFPVASVTTFLLSRHWAFCSSSAV